MDQPTLFDNDNVTEIDSAPAAPAATTDPNPSPGTGEADVELVNPFSGKKHKVNEDAPANSAPDSSANPKQSSTDERGVKREKMLKELKSRKAELESELKKAIEEKDEISKRLILREAEDLKRQKRAADFEEFIAGAEGKVKDVHGYKEQLSAYVKALKSNPAIDKALLSATNPHGCLEALMSYLDEKGYPADVITKMNERQIALTIRNIDRDLAEKASASASAASVEKKDIPKAVIANTTKEDFVPEVKEVKNRKDALAHFAKYGSKGFKVE